jgi:hypothetical protein
MKKILTILFIAAALRASSQIDSVYYHDSGFESQYGAGGAYPAQDYLQFITRFTPPYYPAQLVGVRAWFRNAAQPSAYKVIVRSDTSGSVSANNSILVYMSLSAIPNPSSGGTPDSAYSDYVDLSAQNLVFNSGDVYAGVTQNLQINGFVGIALDTNAAIPNNNRHWLSNNQGAPGSWMLFSGWAFTYDNFGITAFFNPITTSTAEIQEQDIKVFPNPADELLVIGNISLNRNTEVKILDSAGRLVYHNHFTGSIRINTTEWSNGMYFVKVRNKEIDSNLKVAVIH